MRKGAAKETPRPFSSVELKLELELQAQLNGSWTTGTHDRVCGSHVRGFARKAEVARAGRIDCPELATYAIRIGEVGMIEYVKELPTELDNKTFVNGEVLDERKIPVAIARATEEIAPHG